MTKNRMKKLTALCLVLALILCSGVFTAFSEETKADTAVFIDNRTLEKAETLKALGILPQNVTAEDFCSKEGVTRAEIASVMVKMSGMDNIKSENISAYFKDVDDESEYASYIALALELGIINGNGDYTFRPDEYISYEALVKMAVITLGYETQAQLSGGFPTGYLQLAVKLGLKNISSGIDGEAVIGSKAAEFLYSMLDADISYMSGVGASATYTTTEGKTILTENLKIYTEKGIMTGNKSTDLYDEPSLRDGEISIDDVVYSYSGDSSELIGLEVKAYYKEERGGDEKEIIHIEVTDNNRVITVDAEDSGYSKGTFTYYDQNDKKKSVNMYEGAAIIYNSRAITSTDFDMKKLAPDEGYIKLIDNRSAGNYNVIIVEAYTNVVVDSVDTFNEMIYDKYLLKRKVELKDKDYEIFDAVSGKEISLSDISEWDVLSVMESDDNSFYIKRSSQSIGGSVERTVSSGEKVYIDGALYRISKSYLSSGEAGLEIGDTGTFLLDFTGRIAGLKIGRDSSKKVGFVLKTGTEKGLSASPVIKLVTMIGEEVTYYFANSVEVDGVMIKAEDKDASGNNKVLSAISLGTAGYNPNLTADSADAQVIRYSLNSENKINMVDTQYYNTSTERENTLRRSLTYEKGVGSGGGLYFKSKNAAGLEIVNNETITFVVTLPLSGVTEDDIMVTAGSYFTNDNFIIESYVYTEDKIGADVVVCYKDQSDTILGSYSNELLVDDVGKAMGKDGLEQMQISGWYIGSYSTFLVKDTAKMDFEVQQGDLIGFSTNSAGEIYLLDHIYSAKDNKYTMSPTYRPGDTFSKDDFYYANGAGTFDNGRVFTYGHLYSRFENDIIISKTETLSEMKNTDIQTKVSIGSANIYVYDKNDSRNTVRLGSMADLIPYRKDEANPSRIIIRAREALAKTVLIIK